jgi:hypothetical protein
VDGRVDGERRSFTVIIIFCPGMPFADAAQTVLKIRAAPRSPGPVTGAINFGHCL